MKPNVYKHDFASIWDKLYYKIWESINPSSGRKGRHYYLYPAWYHLLRKKNYNEKSEENLFLTQESHRASGIGVNFEGILSGYVSASLYGVKYAYSPLPDKELNAVLSLGSESTHATDLIKQGYRRVRLPYFSWTNEKEIDLVRRMIASYCGESVVFFLEPCQTAPRARLLETREWLKSTFWNAEIRKDDPDLFMCYDLPIVLHIRRGDIGEKTVIPGFEEWWLDNSYYVHIISQLLKNQKYAGRKTKLYIISEGSEDLFEEIKAFAKTKDIEVQYVLNQSISLSWLYMIKAEVLLTGSSSFSWNAALFRRGLTISPKCRLVYPREDNWLVADRDGVYI